MNVFIIINIVIIILLNYLSFIIIKMIFSNLYCFYDYLSAIVFIIIRNLHISYLN